MKKIVLYFIILSFATAFAFSNSNVVSRNNRESVEITLHWTSPVENTDGSPLEDLAGFNVFFRSDTNFVHGQDIVMTFTEGVNQVPQVQGTNEQGEAYGDKYSVQLMMPTNAWVTVTAFDLYGNESYFSPSPLWIDVLAPHSPVNYYWETL